MNKTRLGLSLLVCLVSTACTHMGRQAQSEERSSVSANSPESAEATTTVARHEPAALPAPNRDNIRFLFFQDRNGDGSAEMISIRERSRLERGSYGVVSCEKEELEQINGKSNISYHCQFEGAAFTLNLVDGKQRFGGVSLSSSSLWPLADGLICDRATMARLGRDGVVQVCNVSLAALGLVGLPALKSRQLAQGSSR